MTSSHAICFNRNLKWQGWTAHGWHTVCHGKVTPANFWTNFNQVNIFRQSVPCTALTPIFKFNICSPKHKFQNHSLSFSVSYHIPFLEAHVSIHFISNNSLQIMTVVANSQVSVPLFSYWIYMVWIYIQSISNRVSLLGSISSAWSSTFRHLSYPVSIH